MSPRPIKVTVESVEAASPQDLAWAKKAQTLELEALPAVRATAERWAAALTGLLGAVGLAAVLNGADAYDGLQATAQAWAKGTFFAAAALNLLAAAAAIAAAQLTTRRVHLATTGTYQKFARDAVESAVRRLQVSRWCAAAAVACTVASGAILWWGDTTTETKVVTVRGCGALAPGPDLKDDDAPALEIVCRSN
jgi:hypothetical protein